MLSSIWQYISGFLGVILLGLGIYTYLTIGGLKLELSETKNKALVAITNANTCNESLRQQNAAVEALRVSVRGAADKYKSFVNAPKEVKYRTIYKYIPKEVIVHEDSCENTKRMLNAVKSIKFNEL